MGKKERSTFGTKMGEIFPLQGHRLTWEERRHRESGFGDFLCHVGFKGGGGRGNLGKKRNALLVAGEQGLPTGSLQGVRIWSHKSQ